MYSGTSLRRTATREREKKKGLVKRIMGLETLLFTASYFSTVFIAKEFSKGGIKQFGGMVEHPGSPRLVGP